MPRTTPKQPTVLANGERRYLSVAEVADSLGINQAHVRRAIGEKWLRATKLGGILRVKPEWVDEWVDAGASGGDA